ncbi:hypothetical protein M8997_005990 [Phyllobacterium sp. 21LDTY02-6]|uniref:hypothetical protein n=1 Tax=Phyllobacterium sp. 21LDTY02-6 TaxID=2944903 RepID=UPI00202279F5|nr:hypothetical protein [Phyllobacterium sp. 21LDTY02-6]MCO4316728.1 hypothetical protein [Phyllobacterium sp. 21LDTY02-6]
MLSGEIGRLFDDQPAGLCRGRSGTDIRALVPLDAGTGFADVHAAFEAATGAGEE